MYIACVIIHKIWAHIQAINKQTQIVQILGATYRGRGYESLTQSSNGNQTYIILSY